MGRGRATSEFRYLLVDLLDEIIDLMETNGAFRYFHLDGQTCMLDDYLEIRPENRERLADLLRQGKILIGPWFTMPDLFCPSDEALVRNLLLGRTISREWGVEPMAVAYTCDMFGHPSQMPLIYDGFDLSRCILGRGTNEHTTPAFFRWQSPKTESSVLCFKLQDRMGYGVMTSVRALLESSNERRLPEEMRDEIKKADGDPQQQQEIRSRWFRKRLSEYVEHEKGRANVPVLCFIDSNDHCMPATQVDEYLLRIQQVDPHMTVSHSTLPRFFEDVEKQIEQCDEALPVRRGELREPSKHQAGYLWLIPNSVSARTTMKTANDRCQSILSHWCEPLMAIANLENAGMPNRYLRAAWEYVLQNHAHDSICGCSIDQVHRDMMCRFDQAMVLARQIQARALGAITRDCADPASGEQEFSVTVMNPLPVERTEVFALDLDFPPDFPSVFQEGFRSQPVKHFLLSDSKGTPVPYQNLGFRPSMLERSKHALPAFQNDGPFDRYTVAAELRVPPLGFTTLVVKPAPTRIRPVGSLRTGPNSAENEHLTVEIQSDGTLTVTHKKTAEVYTGLLTFEDRSEIGDGWFHVHSQNDSTVLSTSADLSVVHDGPFMVTFRVRTDLRMPKRYDRRWERPTEELSVIHLDSRITLTKGARAVDVVTRITNHAEDHRLRVLFPTDARAAETWLAHTPYDLVERAIALDDDTATWQEMEIAEKPFQSLLAVGSGNRGLAFLSEAGLHEGAVLDDKRRTIAVTLLRSFRRTVGTEGEPDGLELGTHQFHYQLVPYSGRCPETELIMMSAALKSGTVSRQTGVRSSGFPPMAGTLPPNRSFLSLENGSLIVTAIKPPENSEGQSGAMVVRLWNPSNQDRSDTICFWKQVRSAVALKLSEEPNPADLSLEVDGNRVTVQVAAGCVTTVKIAFGE